MINLFVELLQARHYVDEVQAVNGALTMH